MRTPFSHLPDVSKVTDLQADASVSNPKHSKHGIIPHFPSKWVILVYYIILRRVRVQWPQMIRTHVSNGGHAIPARSPSGVGERERHRAPGQGIEFRSRAKRGIEACESRIERGKPVVSCFLEGTCFAVGSKGKPKRSYYYFLGGGTCFVVG